MPAALFDEVLFDPELVATEAGQRFPISGSPEFANEFAFNPKTGIGKTNVGRFDEIRKITLKIALADVQDSDYFQRFWLGGYGSGVGFRFRYVPDYIATLQSFGVGDGSTIIYSLTKTYTRPGVTARQDVRRIIKPVTNTLVSGGVTLYEPDGVTLRVITTPLVIYVNDVPTVSYTINNTTGIVTFGFTPSVGATLKWSGEFDTPVAFMGNSYEHNFDVPSEINGIQLRELLPAELGIT